MGKDYSKKFFLSEQTYCYVQQHNEISLQSYSWANFPCELKTVTIKELKNMKRF